MEWSSRELSRLHPDWLKQWTREYLLLHIPYMRQTVSVGVVFMLASVYLFVYAGERFIHWDAVSAYTMTPQPTIRVTDKNSAYCRVNPWTLSCKNPFVPNQKQTIKKERGK